MPKAILTKRNQAFIRANCLTLSCRELADHIGCSRTPVSRYLKKEGLTPPPGVIEQFRVRGLTGRTTSDSRTDKVLLRNYLAIPPQRLAEMVGRSETFVKTRLRQLGLVIPAEIVEKRKAESRIQVGQQPFNKGRRQSEYMSKKAIAKTKKTRFKKGHLPKNTKADGVITLRTDNRGVQYKWIRVSLGIWIPLHRHVWETTNGPNPKAKKLVFKNGDTMNCALSNLELLSAGDLMKRNSIHNYPEPIAKAVQLRGALNRQINKHLKRLKNEK